MPVAVQDSAINTILYNYSVYNICGDEKKKVGENCQNVNEKCIIGF